MVGNASPRIFFSLLLVVAFALTGCGKGASKSPPKQQVQDAIAVALPPVLSLDSVELEPISTGPESAKVNFKAIVAPKEDLCRVDREVEGTPRITLLKVAQTARTKLALYGFVEARRTMDLWTLDAPQIQTGLEQLGKPRGDFHSQAYVTGSSEALAEIKQQAANAEIQRQAKEAALRQQEIERVAREQREASEEKSRQDREEKARIAFEEQQQKLAEKRKKEEAERKEQQQAAKQNLLLATAPGTRYAGTIKTQKEEVNRIRIEFTEQNDFEISAIIGNPDNRLIRKLIGELKFSPKPLADGSEGFSIVLNPVGEPIGGAKFIGLNCGLLEGVYLSDWSSSMGADGSNSMQLRLVNDGLEGEVLKFRSDLSSGPGLTIKLQTWTGNDEAFKFPASPVPVQKRGNRTRSPLSP